MKVLGISVRSSAIFVGILATHNTLLFSQDWTLTTAPITSWTSIACSADGMRFVAAAGSSQNINEGQIYISTNSGLSWIATTAPSADWRAVASSADGTRLLAANARYGANGYVYISTNSGATWSLTTAPGSYARFSSVASSANGGTLVAAVESDAIGFLSGYLSISTNSGTDWSGPPLSEYFTDVAASADGSKLFSFASKGTSYGAHCAVYNSTNHGAAWTKTSDADLFWSSVACSVDGRLLVATAAYDQGLIRVSTNSALSWDITSAPSANWRCVASSADGAKLIAAPSPSGEILTSTNSGLTWLAAPAPGSNWTSVACSADGSKMVAVVNGGGIYTWQSIPAPVLDIRQDTNTAVLSWLVPSMPFVLQQNPDLTSTNWTDLSLSPTLNYTNLNYEVTVPTASSAMFYRLATQAPN